MNVDLRLGNCLDVLPTLEPSSVHCCVTSPPYWGLRDYGVDEQIGLEGTPDEYVERMVDVFREVRRVLRDDGTLWLNLGDSYCSTAPGTQGDPLHRTGILAGVSHRRAEASRKYRPETPNGLKPKDLVGIPWMVAFALRADGWYLRSDIIWHKPNPMPESVTDRPTKSHEYLFLLAKSERYYYDADAISEDTVNGERFHGGYDHRPDGHNKRNGRTDERTPTISSRNKRSVWTIPTQAYARAHFATFPEKLVEPCILAGCPEEGTVLDPFMGSGTTGKVAQQYGRNFVGIELNQEYLDMAKSRFKQTRLFT